VSRHLARVLILVLVVAVLPGRRAGADGDPGGGIGEGRPLALYLHRVARDVDRLWVDAFAANGWDYASPDVVLFAEPIQTACGQFSAGGSPFYCPPDQTVYLDLRFLRNVVGDYGLAAAALVVAHEWGHHVQERLGLLGGSIATTLTEPTSVQTELQADCLAGVWFARAEEERLVGPGDLDLILALTVDYLGDPTTHPEPLYVDGQWIDVQHGDGTLRAWWFLQGYHAGPTICGLKDSPPVAH
jgi:uncharacterized protein